ncbi:divergent polysaccharide deacetylase family protein [Rhizobium helianthi]|uniref:Divergent polysaccharide deacetylase family protein n=1 Tax=Rhizobium helianthi TaxID=1132695 RepID=A0ABW4M796_9HYPH
MGTDLRAPLGQKRKKQDRPQRRPSVFAAIGVLAGAGLLGLSFYAMRSTDKLEKASPQDVTVAVPPADSKTPTVQRDQKALQTNGQSGSDVQRTVMDDGTVVTKYSPRQREGEGPVIINAQRFGQDPKMATSPNEDLLEDSPFGRLPVKGPDGLRALEQYARPWSGARGNRIAIVIGGLGLSQTGTQKAIQNLPGEVTFAFAATGNSLQRWMQEARRDGHELLIQMPMEPIDYPDNDPGPLTLVSKDSPKENLRRLHEAMGKITNYTGIVNYLGGRYLTDADAMEPILRDIEERGLLFLDDGTSAQSKTGTIAQAINAPHAFGDMTIDGQLDRQAILRKLDDLERLAQRKGTAIGIGSAFDETVDAVAQWVREAQGRGVEVVGVASLVTDRNE